MTDFPKINSAGLRGAREEGHRQLYGAEVMNDIVERLDDLIKQATTERSHYYVANCAKDAKAEIARLKEEVATCRELRRYDRIEVERLRILLDGKTP